MEKTIEQKLTGALDLSKPFTKITVIEIQNFIKTPYFRSLENTVALQWLGDMLCFHYPKVEDQNEKRFPQRYPIRKAFTLCQLFTLCELLEKLPTK